MKHAPRHVLILGDGSLFDEGLKTLLAHKDGIVVSNLVYSSDLAFVQEFLRVWPEVVVLFQNGPLSVNRVFELLEEIPGLTSLRVITVLPDSTNLDVYEKMKFNATDSNDFLSLIRHNPVVVN